ncbi:hypothetical protein ABGB12_16820 [Actinocorallia sp. B10E7]|uniref:hypothetical protein n=1 Tax=Actinocorallia sp. B10E7 TaxID=3153558 RepID=UPI00325DB93D
MIEDGASLPADLMILPLLFVVTFLLVTAVFAGWRRLTGRGRTAPVPGERQPMGVPAAVSRLRAAGLDPDELLGPWLLEARQGRDRETTLEFP